MRKKLILLSLLFVISSFGLLHSQFVTVAESEVFDEPKDGEAKLIQLASGYTIYYLQDGKSIDIQLFDDNHKKLAEKNIQPAFGLKEAYLSNIFEINGDLTIFL